MCGLCGVYGFIGPKEKEVLMHLQIFSQLRGTDSTGVALIYQQKSRNPEILKTVGGLEALVEADYKTFSIKDFSLDVAGLKCVLSHHRKATVGTINEQNAHPFEFSNIIGCHNGTVFEHEIKRLKNYEQGKIDSYVLLQAINEVGEAAPVLKNVSGAWAFAWWDKVYGTLNFVRNDKRPLWVTKSSDERTLFWASEPWMLAQAMRRCNYKYRMNETEKTVAYIQEDVHYTFGIEKGGRVEIIGRKDAPGWTAPYSYSYNGGTVPQTARPPKSGEKKEEKKKGQEKKGEVVPLHKPHADQFDEQYAEGYANSFIHKRRWLSITGNGCSFCGSSLSWANRKRIRWVDHDSPLCEKCSDEYADELDKQTTEVRSVN